MTVTELQQELEELIAFGYADTLIWVNSCGCEVLGSVLVEKGETLQTNYVILEGKS